MAGKIIFLLMVIFMVARGNEWLCKISPTLTVTENPSRKPFATMYNCGKAFNSSLVTNPPDVSMTTASPNESYTLMMLSTPNATIFPEMGTYFLNMLSVNIKPNGTSLTMTTNKTIMNAYKPPNVTPNVNVSFVILVYRQINISSHSLWNRPEFDERYQFSPINFINLNNRSSFSAPVAGIIFKVGLNHSKSSQGSHIGVPFPVGKDPNGFPTSPLQPTTHHHTHIHKNNAAINYISILPLTLIFSTFYL